MKCTTPTKDQGIRKARILKLLLKRHGFPVTKIFLFGSLAKGTTHPNSDIDIAVAHHSFGNSRMDELRSMCRVEDEEDLQNIEVVYFHPEDLDDKYSTLVQEVKKYGIPV